MRTQVSRQLKLKSHRPNSNASPIPLPPLPIATRKPQTSPSSYEILYQMSPMFPLENSI
ncbi:hypothetical protein GYMLUDRAFT_494797 [Collybiopsis luxurians FD-317 M1]|uniref:Uncharacterized protein n=1 Tax=Collybiopsis luxurians FD-317 M1 TaxID=944289 RepID=A0A0D0C5V5_9AGAR|nr:hypothetical protein GYMLUDRAFT_494797 [Collybiopsis luxurians FD-317 M1]